MEAESKKKVDENWKNLVDKEKKEAQNKNQAYHQPTFSIFLSSMGMQATIAMGQLENPLTGKSEVNFDQARFLIDTLGIIQEKTKNNLSAEEERLLKEYLFNLRMMYMEAKKDDR
jgi:hypothetical protein